MATVRSRSAPTVRVTVPISGFPGGGGGGLVAKRALAGLAGVVRVYVNPATEMAYVEYDPELATPYRLAAALEAAGFRAGTFTPV